MEQQDKPTLLTVGVAGLRRQTRLLDIYIASTLREAVATIRLIRFDLLLVGLDNPKLDVWELMHRVLTAWPYQRWLMVSKRITAEEEVQARSLGVLMVLDELPNEDWLAEFAASLRRRDLLKKDYALPSIDTKTPLASGFAARAEAS